VGGGGGQAGVRSDPEIYVNVIGSERNRGGGSGDEVQALNMKMAISQ